MLVHLTECDVVEADQILAVKFNTAKYIDSICVQFINNPGEVIIENANISLFNSLCENINAAKSTPKNTPTKKDDFYLVDPAFDPRYTKQKGEF